MSGLQGLAIFHGLILVVAGLGGYLVSKNAEKKMNEKGE